MKMMNGSQTFRDSVMRNFNRFQQVYRLDTAAHQSGQWAGGAGVVHRQPRD